MNFKFFPIAAVLCLIGCSDSANKSDEEETEERQTEATDTEEAVDECPGGMGESACCEAGTTLCGTSLTGEECCDVQSQYCATCTDEDEEYTTCLPVGEECDSTGEKD